MPSLSDFADIVIGVDTHVETHTAAIISAQTGVLIEEMTVVTTVAGYRKLLEWAHSHDPARVWAIEGTSSHGAGLARHLQNNGEVVFEVDRPERAHRRNGAKSDPLDATRAAREVLSRPSTGTPRASGQRQALAVLLAARRSAVEASKVAQQQLFALVIAAPEVLREKLRGGKTAARVRSAARLRQHPSWDAETSATATALRTLARRIRDLDTEADALQDDIAALVKAWRPDLLAVYGVGPIVAATVLCAWSHPGRVRSEAAFAMLAGIAPIPANSGQVTQRYRLNRYGDRQLNRAIHVIVTTRQRLDPTTKAYTARRATEGKTPREIRRCLKRYIIRDLYRLLENPRPTPCAS